MKGLFIFMAFLLFNVGLPAQNSRSVLYKVMTLTGGKSGSRDIAGDHSIGGMWQKLLKLKTIASIMHTQAHPDDEHADLLTSLGRGKGVRTSLLSLTRGRKRRQYSGCRIF
jgi:hypothetical protein